MARTLPFTDIQTITSAGHGGDTQEVTFTILSLILPIASGEFPEEIRQRSLNLARRFQVQPMTWAPRWSVEQARRDPGLRAYLGNDASDEGLLEWLAADGFFISPEGDIWLSQEHYQKTMAFCDDKADF